MLINENLYENASITSHSLVINASFTADDYDVTLYADNRHLNRELGPPGVGGCGADHHFGEI